MRTVLTQSRKHVIHTACEGRDSMTTKTEVEARSKVCAFRLEPSLRKKVDAKLKRINETRPKGAPIYGPADFYRAATLALLADDTAVCHEWLADLGIVP
jgi:hypothetical protein